MLRPASQGNASLSQRKGGRLRTKCGIGFSFGISMLVKKGTLSCQTTGGNSLEVTKKEPISRTYNKSFQIAEELAQRGSSCFN